jgi:hypothetical protein
MFKKVSLKLTLSHPHCPDTVFQHCSIEVYSVECIKRKVRRQDANVFTVRNMTTIPPEMTLTNTDFRNKRQNVR